nr:MAG TPA: hypothetical protein [Caudoviricetes sp.]
MLSNSPASNKNCISLILSNTDIIKFFNFKLCITFAVCSILTFYI